MNGKVALIATFLLGLHSFSQAQWTTGSTIYNTNTGNVGIGTSNPVTKLDVKGGDTSVEYLNVAPQNSSGEGGEISLKGSAGNPSVQLDVLNNLFRIHANGNILFALTNSGNLGIGTSTPGVKLDVAGEAAVNYLRLRPQNASLNEGGEIRLEGTSGFDSWITDVYANRYRLWSPTTGVQFTILPSGNVGIGTEEPGTYKLAVEGKIGAREVEVKTGSWADFVFRPGYKLLSLEEVASYVRIHQHLPDIPSEEEVKAKGVNIGEMNAKLLQKIEELTLYMIEQQKNLVTLKQEVKLLQDQRNK